MSKNEARDVVTCPLCDAWLSVPSGRTGWLTCPRCFETVWVSSCSPNTRYARLVRVVNNFPLVFLLGGLLLASIIITLIYEIFPQAPPMAWTAFSLLGLAAVIIVARRSRRLSSFRSEVVSGLKIVFGVWALSGILFAVADAGLSLRPLHVDQLSIHVLLLIQPVAKFVGDLPEPWVPALIATLFFFFFFVLALSGIRSMSTQGAFSRFTRAIDVAIKPVNWAKNTGIGRWIAAAVPAYARWITVFKAASVGVLAFALSASIGGSYINAEFLDAFSTQLLKAQATAVFLRQEMGSLFDKTFPFGSAVPASYLEETRDSLVNKTIPTDGSFDPDTVDRAMQAISYAARLVTTERFEKLIALDEFGVDTSRLAGLRDFQRTKTAQDALNTDSPFGKFSASELTAGWERVAMSSWLEGRAARPEDIIEALRGFLPPSIVCGYCVAVPGGWRVSGPHCLRPGDSPPCPDPAGLVE